MGSACSTVRLSRPAYWRPPANSAHDVLLAHRAGGQRHARREALAFQAAAVTATCTSSTVTPAMRSAESTAERMQCLGAVEMGDHAGL